jgi:hypothetical protein
VVAVRRGHLERDGSVVAELRRGTEVTREVLEHEAHAMALRIGHELAERRQVSVDEEPPVVHRRVAVGVEGQVARADGGEHIHAAMELDHDGAAISSIPLASGR